MPPPELAAKDLGAQEGKDAEKEKEENEEGDDRLNRVDQGAEQVLKGSPVPETRICLFIGGTDCSHMVLNLKILKNSCLLLHTINMYWVLSTAFCE